MEQRDGGVQLPMLEAGVDVLRGVEQAKVVWRRRSGKHGLQGFSAVGRR
jgi:hypothetical protein